MRATIQTEGGVESILVRDVEFKSGWLMGTLDRISCSGDVVSLLRQFEDAANENLMIEVDRIQARIDAFGFVVIWEDGRHARCVDLQLMNGIAVCFRSDPVPGQKQV